MVSKAAGAADLAPHGVEEKRLAHVKAIAELRHPHLIVMRACEGGFEPDLDGGRSLADLQAERGPLPLRVALRILLDAMSGLSALHRARVGAWSLDFVHGEVTPRHIIVGTDGVARLVPLVKAHWSPGSRAAPEARGYTAPEKLLGDAFDQRADVFSAGVLLWEAMMRRSLFGDLQLDDIVTHLVGDKVQHPTVAGDDAEWSNELAEVVMRALSVDPADRWAHVGIMGADIETIAEGRMAKSSDLIAVVTGREVSRDSLSDEVTRPFDSMASLTPLANSIPALDEPTAPDSPGALNTRRSDSTEPVAAASRSPAGSRPPMTERHRRRIVAGALSLSLLLIAVAGIKALGRRTDSTAESTVLAPAALPPAAPAAEPLLSEPPAVDPPPPPAEPAPPPAASVADIAPKPAAAPAAPADAKASRASSKASSPPGKAKPKEDPFGLLKPVRSKPKDDPFGL